VPSYSRGLALPWGHDPEGARGRSGDLQGDARRQSARGPPGPTPVWRRGPQPPALRPHRLYGPVVDGRSHGPGHWPRSPHRPDRAGGGPPSYS